MVTVTPLPAEVLKLKISRKLKRKLTTAIHADCLLGFSAVANEIASLRDDSKRINRELSRQKKKIEVLSVQIAQLMRK